MLLAVVMLLLAVAWIQGTAGSQSASLRSALADEARNAPAAIADFYRRRGFEPLWSEPSGRRLLGARARMIPEAHLLARRIAERLPERARSLAAAMQAAREGDVDRVARAEMLLSEAFGDYRRRLHQSAAPARLAWLDAALAPPRDAGAALDEAAHAPSRRRYLDLLDRVNPIHDALRRGLVAYRADWSGLPQTPIAEGATLAPGDTGPRIGALRQRLGLPAADDAPFDASLAAEVRRFQIAHGLPATGRADRATQAALNRGAAHYERLIRANLERARAFPTVFDGRLLWVNVPAAQLSIIEGGVVRATMRIVAGTPQMPTPPMAGQIRFAVFNPYWNIPVDLVRDRVAPAILREGTAYLDRLDFEPLSDWGAAPHRLDPHAVDWQAVAQGRVDLRVRQRPGPANQMGRVKFMFPNELGIYLHDSPERALFGRRERWLSAGCIRLEDAGRIASWLLGRPLPQRPGPVEQRVDLARPTPVYIGYLTAAPTERGVAFHPDVYRRDAALLAALETP